MTWNSGQPRLTVRQHLLVLIVVFLPMAGVILGSLWAQGVW